MSVMLVIINLPLHLLFTGISSDSTSEVQSVTFCVPFGVHIHRSYHCYFQYRKIYRLKANFDVFVHIKLKNASKSLKKK